MYLGVKQVQTMNDYHLLLTFENDEQRLFDMKPYLEHGIFTALKDQGLFNSVQVCFDTIVWANGADICPETLWQKSVKVDHTTQ